MLRLDRHVGALERVAIYRVTNKILDNCVQPVNKLGH